MSCEYCDEDRYKKINAIKVTYEYENPEAIGYPERVYWKCAYEIDGCPFCGRKIERRKSNG